MPKLSLKIAYPIIIAGLFIIVSFIALNYQTLTLNFYLVLLFLIVYIFLFGFATGQRFSSSVQNLLQKANDLNAGDMKSRSYLESKDELGQLAKAFNKIAEDLEVSRSKNEVLENSVDIKVRVATQALQETIDALEQKVKNRTLELDRANQETERAREQFRARDTETAGLKTQLDQVRQELAEATSKKRATKKAKKEA